MKFKYIIFEDESFVIFADFNHDQIASKIGLKPVGAGFITLDCSPIINGKSTSMGIGPTPDDQRIIEEMGKTMRELF